MAELHPDYANLSPVERVEALEASSIAVLEDQTDTIELDEYDISERNEIIHQSFEQLKKTSKEQKELAEKKKKIQKAIDKAHDEVQAGHITITQNLWIIEENGVKLYINSEGAIVRRKRGRASQTSIGAFVKKTGTND